MSRPRHYTPPLSRFLVCALHHEAKRRGIAMTTLVNQVVQQSLAKSEGWKAAEQQMGKQES